MLTRILAATCVLTCIGSGGMSQDSPICLDGARIHTVSGAVIESGRLLIADGKIIAVGAVDAVRLPRPCKVIDVTGKVIIPGLVDTHSHLGVASRPHVPSNSDGNEKTGPVQAVVRALDSVNVMDPGFQMALAGGLTTANIMPGSGNVIGGQTVYVKLRGRTIEEMQIRAEGVLGGLKMANGENPKRYGSRNLAPATRMKVAALQRTEFMKARDYMRKWQRYRTKSAEGDQEAVAPDKDLALEPLVEVLQGKRTVHFHTHRADDILTVLRLKREFGFELVIQHGTEGYKVIREIAAAGVPVSMTIVDSPGGKAEVVDFIEACGMELAAAGVPIHVNTDDPVTESRFFLRTASAVVRGGLDTATALKAITLYPAQAMHLGHRIGSLEAGKDADFAILSGGPFSIYTRVLQTWIEGQKLFDLQDDFQRLYQTGGFPLADRSAVPRQAELVVASRPVLPADQPAKTRVATASDTTFTILAGKLHTVAGGTVRHGVVHVENGKIAYAGPRGTFELLPGVPVLTAAEVTPGLIDTHTAVPLAGEYNITADQDLDERTAPNQADLRVLDAFHPSEPLLQFLLEQGVTVVHATPGHANVIGGQTGIFRTHGSSVETMTVRFPHAMMFNLGAGPKQTYAGKAPGTRMGTSALIRNA
ncbi:MAG: amidohydrolase family protein, partial [Planctomycetaceae bacterium]